MPKLKPHPKTRQKLGQHFLAQTSWRTRTAETLPVERDAIWLEIGAGHGEMTELLAARARRVIAIETDAALVGPLRERAAHWSVESNRANVEVVHADILSLDLAALVRSSATNDLRQGTASAVPVAAVVGGVLTPEVRLEASAPINASACNNRFRVYGNLPYYITSPILTHLFRFVGHIDSVHIV